MTLQVTRTDRDDAASAQRDPLARSRQTCSTIELVVNCGQPRVRLADAAFLLRDLHGELTAQSEGLGQGATFVLRLPILPRELRLINGMNAWQTRHAPKRFVSRTRRAVSRSAVEAISVQSA